MFSTQFSSNQLQDLNNLQGWKQTTNIRRAVTFDKTLFLLEGNSRSEGSQLSKTFDQIQT